MNKTRESIEYFRLNRNSLFARNLDLIDTIKKHPWAKINAQFTEPLPDWRLSEIDKNNEIIEYYDLAIEALKLCTPITPDRDRSDGAYLCPTCGELLEGGKYCDNCGQKLDLT